MIDENYHISDFDDIITQDDDDLGKIEIENKPVFKSRIIFENSNTSNSNDNEKENLKQEAHYSYNQGDFGYNTNEYLHSHEDNKESGFYEENHYRNEYIDEYMKKNSLFNRFIEGFIIKSYNEKPNTFKWTVVGIIISILILSIGFMKAILISFVILVANIIGQIFDGNSKLMNFFEYLERRFR